MPVGHCTTSQILESDWTPLLLFPVHIDFTLYHNTENPVSQRLDLIAGNIAQFNFDTELVVCIVSDKCCFLYPQIKNIPPHLCEFVAVFRGAVVTVGKGGSR